MNFAARLEQFGNRPALILEDGKTVRYKELARQADAVFRAPGAPVVARTLVAVECDNNPASVAGYLGALRNGFPVLLVSAQLARELRAQLYAHFKVPLVWTATGRWQSRRCQGPRVHPDLALLLSTSGSTGSAKLVRLTLASLEANARSIAEYLQLDERERPVTTLPIHYSYGLSVLNSHLSVGASLLLTSHPVTARRFWDQFREQQATSFAGVPATYAMLRQLRFERTALPSLRSMTQAGGRLAPALVRWFGELAALRGQRFVVMYGQTEAAPRMAYVPPRRVLEKAASIGVPIPGGRLELVHADGSIIGTAGATGELRYTGPNVMMGYATGPADLAAGDTQGGVLHTGDLAWRDDEGYFYLAGRLRRFIKIFGNRIGLDDVEAQMRDKGFDIAVTGRDDLLLAAVRGAASDADRHALTAHIASLYRIHHSAIRVVPVETFPVSLTGKVRYADLLETLAPR